MFELCDTLHPMKTSERSRKLAGVIAQQLPPILQQLLTPNQVGLLTVTSVDVTGDLGMADVWLEAIGAPAGWIDAVIKIKPKVEHELLKTVMVRRPIQLHFKRDPGGLHAQKISQLME